MTKRTVSKKCRRQLVVRLTKPSTRLEQRVWSSTTYAPPRPPRRHETCLGLVEDKK